MGLKREPHFVVKVLLNIPEIYHDFKAKHDFFTLFLGFKLH